MFLSVFSFPVKLGSGFVCLFVCFFFQFCDVSSHSQEDLAKFGYTPDIKQEKSKNPFVFSYLLEPVCTNRLLILKFYFLKSGKIPIFLSQKSYGCAKIIFFRSKNLQKPPPTPHPAPLGHRKQMSKDECESFYNQI